MTESDARHIETAREFTEAREKARAQGLTEFVWRGGRFYTARASDAPPETPPTNGE